MGMSSELRLSLKLMVFFYSSYLSYYSVATIDYSVPSVKQSKKVCRYKSGVYMWIHLGSLKFKRLITGM